MMINLWESYWSDKSNWDWWTRPAPEVLDFISSLSSLKQPKVLDLGCGLGRHAIAFALAGFPVTAIDASSAAVKHLNDWASGLNLQIESKVCELFSDSVPAVTFDIVLGYNVIYHGSREQFARAVQYVRKLLKPGGIFFFTCPSRRDGKYGYGEEIAPHTYKSTKSVTPGDIHYFADEKDLKELLSGFRTLERWKSEGYWDNKGQQQFYSNWHVRAEKI